MLTMSRTSLTGLGRYSLKLWHLHYRTIAIINSTGACIQDLRYSDAQGLGVELPPDSAFGAAFPGAPAPAGIAC